jgi:hypothetical protein
LSYSNLVEQLDLEEIVEKCNVQNFLHEEGTDKTLKVYESIVKTLHDDHDGLGALILQSTEAENEVFSTKWYAKAFDISFRGRSIQPSSLFSLNKKHFYLKIYFQPDDSADALYGGKELLLHGGSQQLVQDWHACGSEVQLIEILEVFQEF